MPTPSRLVGVMYVQLGGDTAPDGFAGPLDTWEAFPGQCLTPGTTDPVFPTKDSVTEDECTEAGGTFVDVTAWIQHVWVVPGWEAPQRWWIGSWAVITSAFATRSAAASARSRSATSVWAHAEASNPHSGHVCSSTQV